MTPSCSMWRYWSSLHQSAATNTPQAFHLGSRASFCQTPIGLHIQREEARGAGGVDRVDDKEELRRSRGVLALIASQHGNSFFKLFKKDVHMCACLEKKKLKQAKCRPVSLEHCKVMGDQGQVNFAS